MIRYIASQALCLRGVVVVFVVVFVVVVVVVVVVVFVVVFVFVFVELQWIRLVDVVVVLAFSLRDQRLRRESETPRAEGFRHLPAPVVVRTMLPRRLRVSPSISPAMANNRAAQFEIAREITVLVADAGSVAGANHPGRVRFIERFADAR